MYQTNDLGFTAALVTLGYKILETRGEQQKIFFFDNPDGVIDMLELDYLNNNLQVEPRAYFNNVKNIKNLTRAK